MLLLEFGICTGSRPVVAFRARCRAQQSGSLIMDWNIVAVPQMRWRKYDFIHDSPSQTSSPVVMMPGIITTGEPTPKPSLAIRMPTRSPWPSTSSTEGTFQVLSSSWMPNFRWGSCSRMLDVAFVILPACASRTSFSRAVVLSSPCIDCADITSSRARIWPRSPGEPAPAWAPAPGAAGATPRRRRPRPRGRTRRGAAAAGTPRGPPGT
ncbi:unnamed protein product [Prorocentrum cordatum]|uniref:Uncharacterized protein n=1 Tax=Prorocentrum cordatum TaxID=2364126 RepID=A0ABN9RI17_9DINO|nr:unnamed protein product [Polarella glacialis]